jgi:hypothetical protein
MPRNDALEARVKAAYDAVPDYIRDDIVKAAKWARKTLTEHEGSGHQIYVTGTNDGMVVCSFAKPEWSGDHCGDPMEHGAEAIVRAVCEYLNGA